MITVDANELEEAMLLMDSDVVAQAWVCRATGKVLVRSDELGVELDPVPDDVDDEDKYATVPGTRRLDLGHALVFGFVAERLPAETDTVRQMFRRPGAYRRFSHLLDQHGMHGDWEQYRTEQTRAAMRAWCEDRGLRLGE